MCILSIYVFMCASAWRPGYPHPATYFPALPSSPSLSFNNELTTRTESFKVFNWCLTTSTRSKITKCQPSMCFDLVQYTVFYNPVLCKIFTYWPDQSTQNGHNKIQLFGVIEVQTCLHIESKKKLAQKEISKEACCQESYQVSQENCCKEAQSCCQESHPKEGA